MKHILIATDGSDHALKAAQFAGELAAGMNAELHVTSCRLSRPRRRTRVAGIRQNRESGGRRC